MKPELKETEDLPILKLGVFIVVVFVIWFSILIK